jgi:hypothetical protein
MGATILGLAAPLTLVLFLLFPRIQGPLWGMPGDAHAGRTGMSDTMEPGNIQSLAQSDDIAFRVKFTDAPPSKSQLYWRGPVLSGFDGRRWFPQRRQTPGTTSVNVQGEAVNYQVTLEPHGKRWLFVLDIPRTVPLIELNPARITYDMQLLASQAVHDRLRYDAVSHLQYELNPNESPATLQQWLELPAGFNRRAISFAADLRSKSQTTSAPKRSATRSNRRCLAGTASTNSFSRRVPASASITRRHSWCSCGLRAFPRVS